MIKFTAANIVSIIVNVFAFAFTILLFKQAFKNYSWKNRMEVQRKLRIATVVMLFALQFFLAIFLGIQLFNKDYQDCQLFGETVTGIYIPKQF